MSPSGGGGGVLFSLLLLLGMTYAQEILHAPESKVVFLDQSAVFTCETVGGVTTWRVNGILLQSLPPEIRSDLLRSETNTPEGTVVEELTIPARAEYNGTRVQCLVGIFGGSSDESENATLRIQGPPSAVVNLTVNSNATSITISWGPPWSLDVTGVDHDIWYSIMVQDVTHKNSPTPVNCTDCTNITETVYTFNPNHLSPCLVYNFSVTPFNGAGQGESDHNVTGYITDVKENIRPTIIGLNRTTCRVMFDTSEAHEAGCDCSVKPEMTDTCDIRIESQGASSTFIVCADQGYTFDLLLNNSAGESSLVLISFTTYDVQTANAVANGPGTINVTGEFIASTTARGCFIVLQCEEGSPDVFRALLLPDNPSTTVNSTIKNVPPSKYTLFVYDLEEDALPNESPAYRDQDNIVTVEDGDSMSVPTSKFIKSASIYLDGSEVKVECVFEDEEGVSCVLVYREYGNETISVKEYHKFPMSVDVGDPDKYSFAVFGKSGNTIDERPIVSGRAVPATTSPTSGGTTSSSSSAVAGVVAGVVAMIILVATGIIVVVVIMWKQKKTRSRKPCPSSAVVPSAFCTSFTKRSDVKSGCGGQSRSSSDSSCRSDTLLIGDQLAEDGSATQAEEKEGKYAMVVPLKSGNRFPPCVDPTAVEYSELNIRATHKMARFDYADVAPSTGNRPVIHDAKTEFPYVDVKLPNPTTPVTSPSVEKTTEKTAGEKAKFQGPPTVEAVMSLIYCVAGRWKMIASGLGFDEDLIDEIYTNNGTDEACLQDCVEKWVSRLGPSWERLSLVLRDLGEESLAQQAWNGVSAEKGTEWSKCSEESYGEGSHEVVTGTREDTSFSDTRNDTTRGGKIHGNNPHFSFGPIIVPFGDSAVSEDQRKQKHTQSWGVHAVAYVTFNGPIKKVHSFVEDDADLFGSPGHQNSSPAPRTAKDAEGNNSPGCTEGLPFGMMNCAQCTDMFPDSRKHFSLDVQCERGTLLVGGKCNYTSSCQKPLSMVPEYLPFPVELSPEPTPPQEPAQVAVEEMGENSHPPTQPPTLPPSSRMELKATKNNNTLPFLDPPENFKEEVVKCLCTGVALGFHGPDSLFRLCSRSSPIW